MLPHGAEGPASPGPLRGKKVRAALYHETASPLPTTSLLFTLLSLLLLLLSFLLWFWSLPRLFSSSHYIFLSSAAHSLPLLPSPTPYTLSTCLRTPLALPSLPSSLSAPPLPQTRPSHTPLHCSLTLLPSCHSPYLPHTPPFRLHRSIPPLH